MSQNESSLCCKVAWCYCRQRCKWWIVAGNHADGNWSLISLQPYQVPCPRYKCHLSPRDLNRKSSKSKLSSCHKHCFGIVQELVSLFWGISFFPDRGLFLSLAPPIFFFSSVFIHPPTHAHGQTQKCFHLWKTTTLFALLFKIARSRAAVRSFWLFFLS